MQEARVARAEAGPVRGSGGPDLPPDRVAEHDRDGDAAVLAELVQQLALDVREVGVVERAEVGAAVARSRVEHHVVALELVDLVVGAALLAGRQIADVDQRAHDALRRASQRSIDSDAASIAPRAASAATSSTSSIRCAAATAVATAISATSSRSRLVRRRRVREHAPGSGARRRRAGLGALTSTSSSAATTVGSNWVPAQRRSSASADLALERACGRDGR